MPRRLIKRSTHTGYKGMAKIGQQASRNLKNAEREISVPSSQDGDWESKKDLYTLDDGEYTHDVKAFNVLLPNGNQKSVSGYSDDVISVDFFKQDNDNADMYHVDTYKITNPNITIHTWLGTELDLSENKAILAEKIKASETTVKTKTMAKNPFIGDNFFLENPSNVLGEQYIEKGKYGNDIVKVKGDKSAIEKIDAIPVAVVDYFPKQVFTDETKQEIINQIFEEENKSANKERLKGIRTAGKRIKAVKPQDRTTQEIYSVREVSKMYNDDDISRDEMEAYYFTHPELNYQLLFDEYTNDKASLIEKGLICYDQGKYVYYYTYISNNVNRKISHLQRDKEKVIEVIGQAQFDRQLKMLQDVRPKTKGFGGDDKIILLPHSSFSKDITIYFFFKNIK